MQEGFRLHLGATPMGYLQSVRLHRAHGALLEADPRSATVAAVAYRWGAQDPPDGAGRRKLHVPRFVLSLMISATVSLGVAGSAAIVLTASHAAFRGTATNSSDAWAAGRVSLSDDDGGTALFTATDLKPGTTGSKCIRVSYDGSLTSGNVKIYSAAPTGTLGAYINLTVEMGTVGAFSGCGASSAASTPISGVLLSTVGTNYATGYATGWSPAVAESRVFKFTYTMSTSTPDDQQSATCTLPFTWEARKA
jgi:hypothetical protein